MGVFQGIKRLYESNYMQFVINILYHQRAPMDKYGRRLEDAKFVSLLLMIFKLPMYADIRQGIGENVLTANSYLDCSEE